MFCERCGTEIQKGAKFCERCGASVESEMPGYGDGVSHKKRILGCIVGSVFLILVVGVGVLFATGILGGNKESLQTRSDSGMLSDMEGAEVVQHSSEPLTEAATEEPAVTPAITQYFTAEPTILDEEDPDEPEVEISDVSMKYLRSVTATSELSERNMVHSVEQICDGILRNAWVEGASGQGIGEAVTFVFDDSYSFSGIKINAGYQKTNDLYYKNSRPQKIKITFSDNSSITIKLKDYYGVQKIDFDHRIVADQVTLTIESVYKGNKYKDTVISELEWY